MTEDPPPTSHLPQSSPGHLPCSSLIPLLRSSPPPIRVLRWIRAKGQFGARDLQKHLWKLSIPEFDAGDSLHVRVSQTGEAAGQGVAKQMAQLRQDRGEVTVTIARRELRKWLRESAEGKAAEEAVEKLLGTGQMPTVPPSGGH